jgi:N-acetylneuraminic acid mutarotase
VWAGGNDNVPTGWGSSPGVYGILQHPSATNFPGSREDSVTWTDAEGHLWLFGGFGDDSVNNAQVTLNDLWMFDPNSRIWTWMGGSDKVPANVGGVPGVYGSLGEASGYNVPGSRQDAMSWTTPDGMLWLLGGSGMDSLKRWGYLNDLWMFNPFTGKWTWTGGSDTVPKSSTGSYTGQPGVYGTLQTPAATNIPGGRSSACAAAGSDGTVWMFGGAGVDAAGALGYLNDLWEYRTPDAEWVWMSGSNTVPASIYDNGGLAGVYGTLGTPDPANMPGSRSFSSCWVDLQGRFWLFSGIGYDAKGNFVALDDLWQFDPVTTEWTWMGGIQTESERGLFGDIGIPSTVYLPSGGGPNWTDSHGDLWLFGGGDRDAMGNEGDLNDVWKFSPSTLEWTWLSGCSVVVLLQPDGERGCPSSYGTLGISAPDNVPGGRGSSAAWLDGNGILWVFGGQGHYADNKGGILNDLWAWGVPASTPRLSLGGGIYSKPRTVTITDATPGVTIHYTTDGTTPGIQSPIYSTGIEISQTATLMAVAIGPGYVGSPLATAAYHIQQPTTIRWPPPAALVYGAALSKEQLNAAALHAGTSTVVPGMFTYSPGAGTVLDAGTHTLKVTFTPADHADHQTATKTVPITIDKAKLLVAANDLTMKAGTVVPKLTYAITGFVRGQSASGVVGGIPRLTTTATSASPAGKYPIHVSPGTLKAENYRFTTKDGTLTIEP